MTLAIPLRKVYGLEDFITMRHLENMAKVLLATGLIVAYGYVMETFMAWYSGSTYEWFMITNRMFGPYGHTYWMLILFNCMAVQLLWIGPVRRNVPLLFVISIIINIGMWLERYVIVITSLHRDYIPAAWDMYHGTFWDYATYSGRSGCSSS